jgi:hypothetical protein
MIDVPSVLIPFNVAEFRLAIVMREFPLGGQPVIDIVVVPPRRRAETPQVT